jgi:hypothetical protein
MRPRRRRLLITLASLAWALVVLYPNPTLLVRAIANARDPDIDPVAVAGWAAALPDDPATIESAVLGRYLPYAVPWQTRGVPWYFPTAAEVVADGRGDCQARMLVLASILEAKDIPHTLRASLDHIWVEYPAKQPNRLENAAIAIMDDGQLQVPERWDWRESYRIEREYFWDFMPTSRRLLLVGGLVALWWGRALGRRLRRARERRRGGLGAASPT